MDFVLKNMTENIVLKKIGSLTVSFQIHFAELQYAQGFKPSFFVKFNAFLCSVCSVIVL